MFNIHFSIERWKWNAEYELWVSNKGHFRTAEKREVPVQVGSTGYCMVYCGGNVHRHLLAHRVVMLTWKPTANAELLTVDHLDHNKRNNAVSNLAMSKISPPSKPQDKTAKRINGWFCVG